MKIEYLISALLLFLLILSMDYYFTKRKYLKRLKNKNKKEKKKKNKKDSELIEVSYLVNKFNLNKEKLLTKKMLFIFSIINSLIITIVSMVIISINTYIILKFILGFILLFALIYSLYELLGRYLKRKGYGENGNKKD